MSELRCPKCNDREAPLSTRDDGLCLWCATDALRLRAEKWERVAVRAADAGELLVKQLRVATQERDMACLRAEKAEESSAGEYERADKAEADLEYFRAECLKAQNQRDSLREELRRMREVNKQLRDGMRFLLRFVPPWAKDVPDGLDPTMYGTLTADGDRVVKSRVEEIAALAAAKQLPGYDGHYIYCFQVTRDPVRFERFEQLRGFSEQEAKALGGDAKMNPRNPECCEAGNQYISWMTAKQVKEVDALHLSKPYGYFIPIHIGDPNACYFGIVRCPFCGSRLDGDEPESVRDAWENLKEAQYRYGAAIDRARPPE